MLASHADAHKYSTMLSTHRDESDSPTAFNCMLLELSKLNVKYLQQLLSDLNNNGAISPFYGDYHRILVNHVENTIMERTILK